MPIFVVQEHWASHHHFDFRLEMGGVLKSWAIPKEVPTETGVKRLAVEVEDHPLSYATFEGVIPEGEYGAGKVIVWDSGKYEIMEQSDKMIKFKLQGKKLKGKYALIKFDGKKNWLLMKETD